VRPEPLTYPIHAHRLDNGLRVVVSPDHSVPVVAVNLWYDVGSRDELPGQLGWAHLFEHLMFSGSAHVASGEHLQVLQSLGGSVNATTWFDRTNYFETVGLGALDLALWLEADRLATLADHLAEGSVETQREVVKEEKRQRYDNVPYGRAMSEMAALVFGPDHPYGHTTIGSMADIDAATAASAADFFRKHYRPDNAVISIVGDVSPRDAFKRVERALGWIPSSAGPAREPAPELAPLAGVPKASVDDPVPAAASYLAWRLPARDTPAFDACDLALSILGAGQTARLHQRIVRERGLAAAVGAQALGLIGGNSLGLAHVRALPGKAADEATEATLAEIDRMADSGPTAEELGRAKAQYAREWLTELARFDSRADAISAYATLHSDPTRINRRLAEVEAVDAAAVQEAASTYLRSGSRAQLDYTDGMSDAKA
jgi:predicted Zn-dependent peptidase